MPATYPPQSLFDRKVITPQVLFLDGLSRAGKFLLGKWVSHFERVEYFRYQLVFEFIPIFWRMGHLSLEGARELLKIAVDISVYEGAIGRNLNTRPEDATSIHKAPDPERYLERMVRPRGAEALKGLTEAGRYPAFLIHEGLPNIEVFMGAYPDLRMINLQRHPVDLAHSWLRTQMIERFGEDPIVFYPFGKGKKQNLIPWWFYPDAMEDYASLNTTERAVLSVVRLQNLERISYESLEANKRRQVLRLPYERLVETPEVAAQDVSSFLGVQPLPSMPGVTAREGCGRSLPLDEREAKMKSLAAGASKPVIQALEEASRRYETQWELEPLGSRYGN